MSAIYVLRSRMVLRVVCEIDGAFVIQVKWSCLVVARTELVEKRSQVEKHTLSGIEHIGGRAGHGSTKHANSVGYVRARLCRAIWQGTDQ
eukprot:1069713-Pleurochrysis_carterae.AAC.1